MNIEAITNITSTETTESNWKTIQDIISKLYPFLSEKKRVRNYKSIHKVYEW